MLDACVLVIVRNGDDYLEPCILQLVDHVKTIKITIDSRSKDSTRSIVEQLAKEYSNIQASEFQVEESFEDLVAMRNSQMNFKEKWGFIVDSDEFHYDIGNYRLGESNAYSLQTYTPWNYEGGGHKACDRAVIGRIFKNVGQLRWGGRFGQEKLYRDGEQVFKEDKSKKEFTERYRDMPVLGRYIHFTLLKKDDWRTGLKQKRVADERDLYTLPDNITRIINNIHGEMPTVRKWE